MIKELSPVEALNKAYDAWGKALALQTEASYAEYNWWADVYNFKRGKIILSYKPYKMPVLQLDNGVVPKKAA